MTEKKYHALTLQQFNTWHEAAMQAEGITPEGKVGYINGVPAPDSQRTTAYSIAIPHPTQEDYYLCKFGNYQDSELPALDDAEAVAAGWFGGE